MGGMRTRRHHAARSRSSRSRARRRPGTRSPRLHRRSRRRWWRPRTRPGTRHRRCGHGRRSLRSRCPGGTRSIHCHFHHRRTLHRLRWGRYPYTPSCRGSLNSRCSPFPAHTVTRRRPRCHRRIGRRPPTCTCCRMLPPRCPRCTRPTRHWHTTRRCWPSVRTRRCPSTPPCPVPARCTERRASPRMDHGWCYRAATSTAAAAVVVGRATEAVVGRS